MTLPWHLSGGPEWTPPGYKCPCPCSWSGCPCLTALSILYAWTQGVSSFRLAVVKGSFWTSATPSPGPFPTCLPEQCTVATGHASAQVTPSSFLEHFLPLASLLSHSRIYSEQALFLISWADYFSSLLCGKTWRSPRAPSQPFFPLTIQLLHGW